MVNLVKFLHILITVSLSYAVNMFNDMGEIVRRYSKNPETATVRLANLLPMVSGEESKSV